MSLRPIKPISLPVGTVTAFVGGLPMPRFEWVKPSSLMVDETYQREPSRTSVRLIMKIVKEWNWSRFKPPVVTAQIDGWHCIDGQHTAIAAATHGGIDLIPVMVIEAPELIDRARSFIGHNKDRIAVTPLQLHHAAAAAGDEDAQTIQQVCDRAGVNLLRYPPQAGVFQPGDIMAIASVRILINKLGAMRARVVLQCLADAKIAPIGADYIKATGEIMYGDGYIGTVEPGDLASTIRGSGPALEQKAQILAMAKKLAFWRALAITLYQNTRKRRGSANAA